MVAVSGNNACALDLYGRLAEDGKGENLFFSPLSISTALSMTSGGARGQTAEGMRKALHASLSNEALHPAVGTLVYDLNAADRAGDFQLSIANALWGQRGHPFLPEFLALNKASYGAGLETVDFAGDTEAARKTINAWAEKQTQDKVKDLIGPRVLDKLTCLVLTNAIYFRGQWQEPFPEANTKDRPFRLSGGRSINVPTMRLHTYLDYAAADGFKAVALPYRGDRLAMLILLPEREDGLQDLEKRLTREMLDGLKLARTDPIVQLPRFRLTCEYRLDEPLKAMGMRQAFSAVEADFSGIDGVKPPDRNALFISAVLHKAFVEVNEKGTEAAAATAVLVAKNGHEPPSFTADHPFIFLIRDRQTGSILFLGRVTNPSGKPARPIENGVKL